MPYVGNGFDYNGLAFGTGNTSTGTEFMRINGSGRVGIGTTNPGSARLNVYSSGNGVNSSGWIAGAFGSSGAYPRVVLGTFDNVAIIGAHSNGLDAWANLSINPGGGRVGIGTTNPSNGPLHIQNTDGGYVSQYIRHASNSNWAIWIQHGATAGANCYFMLFHGSDNNLRGSITSSGDNTISYNTGSDRRFKENIKSIVNPRFYIDQLKPCSFNMIGSRQESIGFIAQEVKEIFPSMVTLGDTPDQYLYLDYSKFSPIAIAGVKQLFELNDQLTARIALLESALSNKSAQLDALMAWAKSQGFAG
jgi:hypothetical protein